MIEIILYSSNFTLIGSDETLLDLIQTRDDFAICSRLNINTDKCNATCAGW